MEEVLLLSHKMYSSGGAESINCQSILILYAILGPGNPNERDTTKGNQILYIFIVISCVLLNTQQSWNHIALKSTVHKKTKQAIILNSVQTSSSFSKFHKVTSGSLQFFFHSNSTNSNQQKLIKRGQLKEVKLGGIHSQYQIQYA